MPVATRWPLVGRHDEPDELTAAMGDPSYQRLCIDGQSRVGKTRLGEQSLAVADAAGRRVLRATAERSHSSVPLAAITHLLPAGALVEPAKAVPNGHALRRCQPYRKKSVRRRAEPSGVPAQAR
jgi:hypothetical protein